MTMLGFARSRLADLRGLRNRESAIVLGAGLLSAIGSLALHLMPLIVATLVTDERISLANAGWVASAVLVGQLLAALSLPAIRIRIVGRPSAMIIVLVLLIGLTSTLPDSQIALLLGWFVAGLCFGALQYLGLTTAAASARPAAAFALRLGVVMLIAGAVAASVRLTGTFASYQSTVIALSIIVGGVAAAGLSLYRVMNEAASTRRPARPDGRPSRGIIGLATLLVLFMGQTGFMAYAIQSATQRGLALTDTILALAGMKIIVGAWLISTARGTTMPRPRRLFAVGVMLALGVLAIAAAQHLALFFLGLLVFEIAFNSLSAALQAKIVEAAQELGRSWLTAAALIGAALGPPLNGSMIELAQGHYFIAFAMFSALAPALWAWRQRAPAAAPEHPA
jgi:predicted MFS family arabinose efflux permease